MTEIGEASVLIRPDTSQFRTLLQAQLTAIINTAVVPPIRIPVITQGLAGTTAATSALTLSNEKATTSFLGLAGATQVSKTAFGQQAVILGETNKVTRASSDVHKNVVQSLEQRSKAERSLARDVAERSRQEAQALRGAAATGLSLFGLRGATLAASAPFLAGAAAITAFAKSVGAASSVQRNLNVIQAVLGATASQMAQVRAESKALAADVKLPAVSALDATTAIRALAEAGLGLQKSLQAARPALLLARAAEVDVGTAAQDIASQLNSFALAAGDAGHVADVLALAAHKSQQSLQDVSSSLEVIAPISRQFGISLNDSAALLSLLAQNGVRGAAGANVLRFAIVRLLAPSKKVGEELTKLGIIVRDSAGNFRPEVFREIEIATRKLTPALRESALATIFGARSLRVQAALGQESIRTLEQTRAEFTRQGTAQQEAARRAQGLAGRARELKATLEDVGVAIGQSVTPGLTGFVSGITSSVQAISSSQQVRQILSNQIAFLGQQFKILEGAVGLVGPPLLNVAGALQGVVSAIGTPAILAGVAAYKLFVPAFQSVFFGAILLKDAFTGIRTAIAAATAETTGLATASAISGAALRGIVGGIAAFAASTAGAAIIVGTLAAGIVFLITRESELDRANKALNDSTQKVADAMDALDQATTNVRHDVPNLVSAHLGVQQAILARQTAERALATSSAPTGSVERRTLELTLAQAINGVTIARQQEHDAGVRSKRDLLDETDKRKKFQKALAEETGGIQRIVRALEVEAAVRAAGGSAAGRADVLLARDPRVEANAIDLTITKLRQRADALKEEGGVFNRTVAQRLLLIASLEAKTRQLATPRQIEIVLSARSIPAALNQLVQDLGIKGKDAAAAFRQSLLDFMAPPQDRILALFKGVFDGIVKAAGSAGQDTGSNFVNTFLSAIAAARGRIETILTAAQQSKTKGATHRLTGLQEQFTLLEISGASPQTLLANLKQQEAAQREIVTAAKSGSKKRNQDNKDLLGIIDQERSIQQGLSSKAKTARSEADQAVLDIIGNREAVQRNRILVAQGRAGLQDDIRTNQQLLAIIRRGEVIVRQRIQDRKTKAQELLRLRTEEIQTKQTIADLRQQQFQQEQQKTQTRIQIAESEGNTALELRLIDTEIGGINKRIAAAKRLKQSTDDLRLALDEAKQKRRDIIQQQADTRLQILQTEIQTAQITNNRRVQEKLLRAEIGELEDQVRGAKKGSLRRAQLIQELRQAQKDLATLAQERQKVTSLQKAEFAFLQAQQGFASNLIGNLIPLGATGLVGGNIQVAQPKIAPLPGAGGFPPPEKGARTAAQIGQAARDRGVTSGQGERTINVLHQILQALIRLNRGAEHPEAHHQRRTGSAIMDYHGESAGM